MIDRVLKQTAIRALLRRIVCLNDYCVNFVRKCSFKLVYGLLWWISKADSGRWVNKIIKIRQRSLGKENGDLSGYLALFVFAVMSVFCYLEHWIILKNFFRSHYKGTLKAVHSIVWWKYFSCKIVYMRAAFVSFCKNLKEIEVEMIVFAENRSLSVIFIYITEPVKCSERYILM